MAKKKVEDMMIINTIKKIKKERVKIEKIEDYYYIFSKLLKGEDKELQQKEHAWIMGVNDEGYIVCVYIVALGAGNFVNITAHDLFKTAINHSSQRVILAHNHPDVNEIIPSDEDVLFTNKVYHMANIVGLTLLDHIIISTKSLTSELPIYYSYKEMGVMQSIHEDISYTPYEELKPMLEEEKEEYAREQKSKGLKEGEHNKSIAIAKEMLKNNEDIKIIIKYTKLTEKEIMKITTV